MNDRILAFLAATVAATILLLAGTYKEYRPTIELVLQLLGVVGSILALYEFFRKRP